MSLITERKEVRWVLAFCVVAVSVVVLLFGVSAL